MNDPYMQGGDDLSDPISLSGVSPMRYMANGGFVVPPQLPVVYRPEDREYLEARQAEAEAYDAQRTAYNAALEKYKTEVYNPYESQLKAFNAAAEAYNRDVYGPYQAAYKTYEEAVNAFNAGPMETEYAGPEAPTLRPFEMQAPVAPAAFSMTAPTVPFKEEDVAARQAQAAEAARQDAASRQFAFEAINDPGQYNLAGMSQGSGIAGLSVPGYVKGGPVFAKAPGVLSAKQMLRKLGNKTKKFADGGAVTSPTLAERVAALQKTISSMPEVIATKPNPALAAARQELAKLTGTFVLPTGGPSDPFQTKGLPSEVYKQNRFQVIDSPFNPGQSMVVGMNGMVVSFGDSRAVKQMQKTADDYNDYYFGKSQAAPSSASSPVGVLPGGANAGSVKPVITPAPTAVTTVTTPTPTTAKTDLTELSKPVVVSTPPASGNAAGAAGSVIAATPSVFSGARPITALPVVPGSAPALQKPISTTAPAPTTVPAPGSAKSALAEISKPGSSIPNPPSGSVVAPSKHPDGNVYGTYTSSDGKWFWDRGKWAKNEVINISPIERPDYPPPGTKPPATQPPPLMGALPIKEFMPPVAPQPVVMSPTKTPVNPLATMVLGMAVKRTKPDMMWDATGDGRISAADALQVAKGWRPKGYQEKPVTTLPESPPQIAPPARPTPPSTPTPPVTTQPVVPVPTLPTIPDTPPLFRPPPPGSMPGTLPMPFNPFQISQGPTALDLLKQSPNLSPNILGGQGNLGFMKDRLGNVIRAPGAVRAFADGGEVEDEEPILTDPVGTASQMLRELNPQTQMEYEATPKKVSMKRISKTPMESASGSAKGMKMELEEISAMKMPKDAKRRGSLSKAEFEDLAREYGLKRDAALSSARGLMSETFGKPTLEKPSLTKRGLTKRRFEKGGEVKKSGAKEDKEPGLFGVSSYATRKAEEMFPNQMGQDDQRDAARHMLAAGLVARQYGPRAAELLGKAHEYTSNPHTFFSALGIGEARDDLPYDLHNNRVGIELGMQSKSKAELEALVRSLARQSSFEQKPGVPWIMGPEAIRQRRERAEQRARLIEQGSQY